MTKCLNINAYGCSFSQGLKNIDNGKSWPNYLLELIPDNCCINNYALAGSSLEYSVYNLQKQKNYADINIFQITNAARLMLWEEDKLNTKQMIQVNERYKRFDHNCIYKILNLSSIDKLDKKNKKWLTHYYKNLLVSTPNLSTIRYSHLFYVKMNSDFCFTHILDDDAETLGIFQNDKIFKIDKYAVDAGDHFSKEGNMLIAENVYNKIKEKLI